jgi:hypothetical protein
MHFGDAREWLIQLVEYKQQADATQNDLNNLQYLIGLKEAHTHES